jgi:hypothetical protein
MYRTSLRSGTLRSVTVSPVRSEAASRGQRGVLGAGRRAPTPENVTTADARDLEHVG